MNKDSQLFAEVVECLEGFVRLSERGADDPSFMQQAIGLLAKSKTALEKVREVRV